MSIRPTSAALLSVRVGGVVASISTLALLAWLLVRAVTTTASTSPGEAVSDCSPGREEVLPLSADLEGPLTLTLQGESIPIGATAALPLVLDQAPDGLAGFHIEVRLTDPTVARITGVEFPGFGLSRDFLSNGSSIRIAAADLLKLTQSGASGTTLATLQVEGLRAGTAEFQVRVLQMDDDSGGPMAPRAAVVRLPVC